VLIDKKTIFAPATGTSKSGVAIIRVSGNNARHLFGAICNESPLLNPRKAVCTPLKDPRSNEIIDYAIVIWFPAPHSFTGEDTLELHIHGSIAIINILLEVLATFKDFRLALPGEFARRAFLNDKMDLTKAEGLADLIDAETKIQHKQALRQYSGELENLYSNWREEIIAIMANLEVMIDFPDEDLPLELLNIVENNIIKLKTAIIAHLSDNNRGEKLRNGLYASILGMPNVGKSTFINLLAKRDIAIVSNHAGTTRDVLEAHLDIGGFPITVADTAGIRETENEIETEGIKRAISSSNKADIKIIIIDPTQGNISSQITDMIDEDTICIINKIDNFTKQDFYSPDIKNPIFTSFKTGENVDSVIEALRQKAQSLFPNSSQAVITRERYRYHLKNCLEYLDKFSFDNEMVLAAEDLRLAAHELSQILGTIDIENILDKIFSSFCLGK
jgi:tRNA modification GTPase